MIDCFLFVCIFAFVFFVQVITSRGGRFLEAPVSGSQQLSNEGMLVILAAGDRSVYEDCSSCFQAMGKTSFFLGTFRHAAYVNSMHTLGQLQRTDHHINWQLATALLPIQRVKGEIWCETVRRRETTANINRWRHRKTELKQSFHAPIS